MMKSLPIRWRLTLWYSIMFATAALLLSSASWWMLRHTIDATTRQDLQERIDDVRAQLKQLGPALNQAGSQARFDAIYRFRDEGKWLQIADQNGHWIYRSPRMIALPGAADGLANAGPRMTFSEFDQGTHHVRAVRSQIDVGDQRYTVETGIATNKQLILLRRFGLSLLLLTPAVFAGAVFVGHWMSRKALSPVEAIANEARRITERNLDRRLPVSSADDELAHLSVTLNNMLGRIDAGFRSVRDFTANASHELRTPLALLRTEAEIALLRPRSPQEYRDTLEHMQTTSAEMATLLESLLALARAEAGAENLRLSEVDVPTLLHSVFAEWLPITRKLGIELRLDLDSSRPLIVVGDRLALQQLLRIWLDNACKFTQAEGRIVLSAESLADSTLLGVRDSGTGIALDEHERIFERFYRIKEDHGRNGAGLGLSLAAWIAEQHGSRIQVESALSKGSMFFLALQNAGPTEHFGSLPVSVTSSEKHLIASE